MDRILFEWDERKNTINKKKHGVSFEEAKTVFYDVDAILIDDPDHSEEEERFLLLGLSRKTNLLIVCHCLRDEGVNGISKAQERKSCAFSIERIDNALQDDIAT